MVFLVIHALRRRDASAGRPWDLRDGLRLVGWVTAGVVAVSTALTGLPTGSAGRVTAILLTVCALGAWLVSLDRQVRAVPLLVGCLVGTGLAGAWLSLLHPSGPGFLVSFMAMAGIGLQLPRRVAVPAGAIVLLAAGLAQAHGSAQPFTAALGLATGAGFLFLAAAFAAASRTQQAQTAALLEQQEQTRLAREQATVLAERARLARELHDVLAHSLAGLAVHLEAARLLARTADADPRLVEQITAAQRLARDGMAEAKRAVSTLRDDDLPGPDDLPEVIEQARRGGLTVGYAVTGRPRHLAPEAGLAVYRAVQEALTNTTKHAGATATASVTVVWGEQDVRVEVTDRGGDRTPGDSSAMPSGHYGLVGLAERAALAGGRLNTGPTADGWQLCLTLPLAASTAVSGTAAAP
jgi:signal transduction histidine kinase